MEAFFDAKANLGVVKRPSICLGGLERLKTLVLACFLMAGVEGKTRYFNSIAITGPLFGLSGSTSSPSPFASTVAPVFGGTPTFGKIATPSIFATKSTASTSEEPLASTSSSAETISAAGSFEQGQERQQRQGPRLSRTPIVWNSPPGSSQGATGAPPGSSAPTANPQQIGGRGQKARRSKPRGSPRGGLPQ